MRRLFAAAVAASVFASMAQAQDLPKPSTATATAAAIDPQRLAAARDLMDVLMPPEDRDAMFESIVNQVMGTMLSGLGKMGDFDAIAAEDPRVREVMGRFIERQRQRAIDTFKDSMPELMTAYANAYARAFTLDDLKAMKGFFGTPVGRRYVQTAPRLLGDPDIAAWMQRIMQESRESAPSELNRLMEELKPLLEEKHHAS